MGLQSWLYVSIKDILLEKMLTYQWPFTKQLLGEVLLFSQYWTL